MAMSRTSKIINEYIYTKIWNINLIKKKWFLF